ncbi:alpha/beta hydrolase [Actinokineospora iranica]|uniref:Lysophospholipase, alpha-beta hydrolase superfamily n=1 Tax=Actinokineospora iranica TaxID=1271860 RepID=A0A1G6S4F8_9PSEU|nr:alpha/beta hydrolase [Actinokineospora iranica]SDD11075.1 Lysophospholipase, alpha-beta hydrolase superfamily [Actinokineospora iranica]
MRWSRSRKLSAAALLVATAVLLPAQSPAGAAQVACSELRVPVSVAGTAQTMAGTLCAPEGATSVQVLVPGGTYNRSYWDIAYTPGIRSFRLAMNKAGHATFAVDRLGTGESSKPPSALVTSVVQAEALHQVVQTLRPRFDKVLIGGHSIGAAMAMIEAGLHRDVDGVLVTGMTHRMNLVTVAPVLANMIPAPLDSQLARRGPDLGYLTTSPGTRAAAFHGAGKHDPAAIAADESTKDVFAATEALDNIALTNILIPASRGIDVPVLLALGEGDTHFCGAPLGSDCRSAEALRASEAPYFSGSPRFETFILPGYGHSMNYAPNAPDYHRVVAQWAGSVAS